MVNYGSVRFPPEARRRSEDFQDFLRSKREALGLTRAELAARAASDRAPITMKDIERLEDRAVRLAPAEILRPVTEALGLDWISVLQRAGYW